MTLVPSGRRTMLERSGARSPGFTARMAGLAYVLMTLAGVLARVARRGLIVAGDAAATATNILAHPVAYRANIAGELLVVAFYIAVIALLYRSEEHTSELQSH